MCSPHVPALHAPGPITRDLGDARAGMPPPTWQPYGTQTSRRTGIGSDPGKLAEFRALMRMRRAAPQLKEDPAFDAFSRLLLKAGPGGVHPAGKKRGQSGTG